MKKYITPIILLICFSHNAQKNNYDKISYGYVNRILHPNEYQTKWLYGRVKSLHIEHYNAFNKPDGQAMEYHYDTEGNITAINNYDHDELVMKRSFYATHKDDTRDVVNYSENLRDGVTISKTESIEFPEEHLIVTTKLINGKLYEIDSITYIDNYKPILIKHYSIYRLEHIYHAAYTKRSGKLFKEAYERYDNAKTGMFIQYDADDREISRYKINFEQYTGLNEEDIPTESYKYKEINWTNTTDFKLTQSGVIKKFDMANLELTDVRSEDNWLTYKMNTYLQPVEVHSINKKYEDDITTLYTYNAKQDVLTTETKFSNFRTVKHTYTYTYDNHKNWVERKDYENGKLSIIIQRIITYY